MSTQTKTQQRTASSEGTQAHTDKAQIALNIKYFQIVQGMSRDEAQKIVANLQEKGELMSAAECNAQITRFKKDETRRNEQRAAQEERERSEKARKEKEERARQEYEDNKKREEMRDLTEVERAMINDFIAKGATRGTIKGMMKDMFGMTKGNIDRLINELMPEKAKAPRSTFNSRLDARLIEGIMTSEELIAFIGDDKNAIKNHAYHLKRMMFANALHTKYQKG